jgi:hypothetical protein
MALTDRMNGIFAALEIPPDKFTARLMNLPLVSMLKRTIKGSPTCHGRLPFATLRLNSLLFMLRLRKKLLGGQYLDKKDAGC